LGRIDAFGMGRYHLVLYLDEFSRVSRSRQVFRNDKRDALAHEANSVVGKRVVRRDEDRLTFTIA
jgi:hypothetical protein